MWASGDARGISPLVASQRTNYTAGLAETEGTAVDAAGRLWVVTNFIEVDPAIYTYARTSGL